MTEKPFIHKFAFKDLITNFIFHEDVVKMFPKLLKENGIINLGGKTSSVYKFAKETNKDVYIYIYICLIISLRSQKL